MSARPPVVYGKLELHLSADPDFPARHGHKVKRAGGKYSDIRGDARTRYVTVPAAETALVDELARIYSWSPQLTVVARELTAEGYADGRIGSATSAAHNVVFKWRGEDKDGPLSAFVRIAFERKMAAIDWQPALERWRAEDEAAAARQRRWELDAELARLREAIAAEAVRIADGANDIEPLKELARRYRDIRPEAVAAIERDAAEDEPSLRM